MAVISEEFLHSIGIDLSPQEAALLSEHFETTLHERIFHEVAQSLDQNQAEELLALLDRNDPQVSEWLKVNVPELREIVRDEIDILMGELVENKDKLVG